MKSFDLENAYEEPEKRIVNVSEQAASVIRTDMLLFSSDGKEIRETAFFNTIFDNYIECVNDEVDIDKIPLPIFQRELNREYNNVEKCLSGKTGLNDSFKENYRKQFIERMKREYVVKEKGIAFKFRLRKNGKEFISGLHKQHEHTDEEIFDYNPAVYLNTFFDRYARMQYADRERLYYFDKIMLLQKHIASKSAVDIEVGKDKKFIVPYKICTDKGNNYNYLVALVWGKKGYTQQSFRISAIKKVLSVIGEEPPEKIDQEFKALSKNLSKKGPEFLTGDEKDIKVRLSEQGKKMYEKQLHLRPNYDHIEDGDIYCFKCSTSQILYYFFKYGEDAEVIEPEKLRNSFAERYEKAAEKYKKEIGHGN